MGDTKVPSPGEILQERFLEPNGITPYRLAQAIGRPQSTISLIINGKRGITAEMASLLGQALGTSAEFWMDVDSRYQLDKLNGEDMEQVDKLIDEKKPDNEGMYHSGGYIFSSLRNNDEKLGSAVRGVYAAMAMLNGDDQEHLLHSVSHYLMYGTIEFPGVYMYNPDHDHIHREVFAIFHQFLIAAGEDYDEVHEVSRGQWMEMISMVGKYDKDGNPIEDMDYFNDSGDKIPYEVYERTHDRKKRPYIDLVHEAYLMKDKYCAAVIGSLHGYLFYGYKDMPENDGTENAAKAINAFAKFLKDMGEDSEEVQLLVDAALE